MTNLNISRAERLDQYVVEQNPLLSRMYAVKLIEEGKVIVNGQTSKPGYKIRRGDVVIVDYDNSEHQTIPRTSMPIVYEDDDVLVLNKPAGILTHSKGVFSPEASVASFVRQHITGSPSVPETSVDSQVDSKYDAWLTSNRIGIVHRLDRATSGIIICAKNHAALIWLQKQFSLRKVKKTYIAVIEGRLKNDHAIIDIPIERNPKEPKKFRTGMHGKPATTEYMLLKATDYYSLLELSPKTGRTHQLRVHLMHFGHPIVGDPLYNGKPAVRMYLHALSLEITLPSHERKVFEAALPQDFTEFMQSNA